jgi:hypothetical protein
MSCNFLTIRDLKHKINGRSAGLCRATEHIIMGQEHEIPFRNSRRYCEQKDRGLC